MQSHRNENNRHWLDIFCYWFGLSYQIQDIDEIHKVFNDLKESNANFQTVFDIAPIVLWKPEGLPAQIAASTGKPYSKLNLI